MNPIGCSGASILFFCGTVVVFVRTSNVIVIFAILVNDLLRGRKLEVQAETAPVFHLE